MDENQIRVGCVYWAEYVGRRFRIRVTGKLPLCPGWWACQDLETGSQQAVPTYAFIGLDASGDLLELQA